MTSGILHPKASIVIVEDETIIALSTKMILEGSGYSVPGMFSSGERACEEVAALRPDVILMDIMLEGRLDGVEAADCIRRAWNAPVIYMSAYMDPETMERALSAGGFFLRKPFDEESLEDAIELALGKRRGNGSGTIA